MAEETVKVGTGAAVSTSSGTPGVESQAPGQATTVSSVAGATGGIAPGNLVETDIDSQLFRFQSEDTALMSLMLKAKKVKVSSPEVEHFMIDEQRSTLTTDTAVAKGNSAQFVLPLNANDQDIPRDYHTLLVPDVDGYTPDGQTVTPGKSLMLFVTGRDTTTNNPVVRAVNGPKASKDDVFCTTPAIPAGSKVKLLANAMYETQKEVDPDLIVPRPSIVYLQKRGMKCIDFSKHPEIQISTKQNPIGWSITSIHTVFGDIDIKREPTLDTLGWSNSGALLGEDRLVHYTYSQQHEFNDRVEGEEATRKGIVVWDGLALKGACHIWIDGEGEKANAGATTYAIWESEEAPAGDDLVEGRVYLLTVDCPGINAAAQNGQMWQYKGDTGGWVEFTGEIIAD